MPSFFLILVSNRSHLLRAMQLRIPPTPDVIDRARPICLQFGRVGIDQDSIDQSHCCCHKRTGAGRPSPGCCRTGPGTFPRFPSACIPPTKLAKSILSVRVQWSFPPASQSHNEEPPPLLLSRILPRSWRAWSGFLRWCPAPVLRLRSARAARVELAPLPFWFEAWTQ